MDVEARIAAHQAVLAALNAGRPRVAATLLCDELSRLADDGDYWNELAETTAALGERHGALDGNLAADIRPLLLAEERIFARLGIDDARAREALGHAFGGLDLLGPDLPDPRRALGNLRDSIRVAADRVCAVRGTPLRQARDWVLSWKGLRVLAGAAVAGANVAVAFTADGGVVSWQSVKVGVAVMRGDVDNLIRLMAGGDDG